MATTLPSASVLMRAAQVAIDEDKPIYLDYYSDSIQSKCCIAIQDDNTKHLVKSESEYTSAIEQVFKCEQCYIVATENSLYVVSVNIPIKKIVSSTQS